MPHDSAVTGGRRDSPARADEAADPLAEVRVQRRRPAGGRVRGGVRADVVAGMATVTRGSARHQRRRASGQPERPAAASSAGNDRRSRDPSPSGRMAITPSPSSRASGRIRSRAFVLDRVEGHLDGVDPSRSHHRLELAERRRLVRRRAQPADGPGGPLALHPVEVRAPGDQVVDLQQVDPAEPPELVRELARAVRRIGCPDLGRDERPRRAWTRSPHRAAPPTARTSASCRRSAPRRRTPTPRPRRPPPAGRPGHRTCATSRGPRQGPQARSPRGSGSPRIHLPATLARGTNRQRAVRPNG